MVAAVVAATTAATGGAIQPVIARDFPDPAVLAVGSTYYAYSTGSSYNKQVWHVPVQKSPSLTGRWTEVGDALPELPAWVNKEGVGHGNVWAPEVAARSDGSYILYFTARAANQNVQCIGVALASSPQGPFKPVGSKPLVCRPEDVDSIDPKAFTDTDGKQYLLYTSGRGRSTIWLQQVSVDGMTSVGERRALIQSDRPEEGNIIEAPTLVHHGDRYVLFYSGNAYNSGKYFVNYATSESLASTFVKHPGQFLNKDTLGGAMTNPGGQDVIPGSKHDYLLFHAYTGGESRAMFASGLSWDSDGNPVLELNNVAKAPTRRAP
ncbi:glycoside hydrolase family 43 protein [Pseudonocardia acaciae]|uniref:glycoside hydrolase family 43 protein n=1 Tax=Pseudonocardia acaciae TaxID=551276 RepID=UPI0014707D28|nr:glycoside hydrolase family 43 protein [Pseudonocardia acaciae]